MTAEQILAQLKIALGEPNASTDRVSFLTRKINDAIERLKDNGINLETENDTYSRIDAGLICDYAEFLVNDRNTQNGLPRHLQWAIHNRIIEQGREDV